MNNYNLSIVFPAYNEANNLSDLLPRVKKVLSDMAISYEIIVVDTINKIDHTEEVCSKFDCKYVIRESGNSFGDAMRTGIKNANGKYTLIIDADGSHTPEFIPTLYNNIAENDVVIASRYVSQGSTECPYILTVMSKILNITYSIILNIKCKDISNNFKIYKTSQLKSLNLKCNNFDLVEEILYKLSKKYKPLKIKEVPFKFKKRMHGKTKRNLLLFIFTYLITIIKLRFGK